MSSCRATNANPEVARAHEVLARMLREDLEEIDRLRCEHDMAGDLLAEVDRLRAEVQRAEQERDEARRERDAALARIEAAGRVISEIGCECVCDHAAAHEDHDDDCEPCHLCRIEDALQPKGRG